MCFFLNDGVSMLNRMLIKAIVGFSIACASLTTFAASIEGYWKSIDDRTGEQQSIVQNVLRLIPISQFWVWKFFLDLRKIPISEMLMLTERF